MGVRLDTSDIVLYNLPMSVASEHTVRQLLREPSVVLDEATERDIRIKRRDAADLMLSEWDREESIRESLGLFSTLLRTAIRHWPERRGHDSGLLASVISDDQTNWMAFLAPAAQIVFVTELLDTALQCVSLGHFEPLDQVLREWRATAAIAADPNLRDRLKVSYDDPLDELVPDPHGGE